MFWTVICILLNTFPVAGERSTIQMAFLPNRESPGCYFWKVLGVLRCDWIGGLNNASPVCLRRLGSPPQWVGGHRSTGQRADSLTDLFINSQPSQELRKSSGHPLGHVTPLPAPPSYCASDWPGCEWMRLLGLGLCPPPPAPQGGDWRVDGSAKGN